MKKAEILFTVLVAFILMGCSGKSATIEIANTSKTDRFNEIVTLSLNDIQRKLVSITDKNLVLLDESGKAIPFQIINNKNDTVRNIIFPVSIAAEKTIQYTIKEGTPGTFKKMTFGRSVPERKDDFAWENDRIAFRMYGPALAPENPSNGVDIWLKRTNELIVDTFYNNDLNRKISYHTDHGLGLDCYKVAHTLGAGGIAPFVNDSLWVGNHYDKAQLIETGPLRTTFVLTYDSVKVNDKILSQQLTITLDACSQLNKAIVSYDGDFENIQLAAGIWLHDGSGSKKQNKESGYIAYAENAVSEAGEESGRNYIGVIFPQGMTDVRQQGSHLLGIANYKKGEQLTYYFGAGWSKWGFGSDDDWFNYIDKYSAILKQPLTATIK